MSYSTSILPSDWNSIYNSNPLVLLRWMRMYLHKGTLWGSQFSTLAACSSPCTAVHCFHHLHQPSTCSAALHKQNHWTCPVLKEVSTHIISMTYLYRDGQEAKNYYMNHKNETSEQLLQRNEINSPDIYSRGYYKALCGEIKTSRRSQCEAVCCFVCFFFFNQVFLISK